MVINVPLDDAEEIYRRARIARGWIFGAATPVFRQLSFPSGASREEVLRIMAAVMLTQAAFDSRHMMN
jgi:hypothetical protein